MSRRFRPASVVSAGLLLGAGLGGFFDGIVFHQILQWHHMLSSRLPPTNLVNVEVNMFWDGIFHASVWVMTTAGVVLLWRAGCQQGVRWSGRTMLGACAAGWGLFNVIEGLINHQVLGLHHVCEDSPHQLAWDLGFLAFGVVMVAGGGWVAATDGRRVAPRGRAGYMG